MDISLCTFCNQDTLLKLIVFIFRGIILILCTTGGLMSIYLGWRLYKDSMLSPTEGTAQFEKFTFRLVSGGPGIFFCAFGMWLLVHLVDREVRVESQKESMAPAKYQQFNKNDYTTLLRDNYILENSPTRFIKTNVQDTQASTQDKESCQCLIRKSDTIVFFSGDDSLTPETVKNALEDAFVLLRSQINLDAPDGDQLNDKLDKVSQILKKLEERVEVVK